MSSIARTATHHGRRILKAAALAFSAAAQAEAPAEEDEIIVTGRAAKLYRVEETRVGKLATEPLASSQAVTVVTGQLIADQGARDAQDLYRNISGVSQFSYAGVTARGFRQQENFYDDLRGDPYIGFSVPQLFNIERVEFLKGPAGMLYGQTAPGGLFNYVTKGPQRRSALTAQVVGGTGDRWGGQVEATGPIGGIGAFRAGAFHEARDLPRRFAGSATTILDGGLAVGDDRARISVQALHVDQDLDGNRLRGVPVDNAGNFLASRRWNHNEPSDYLDLRSDSVQLRGEVRPTEHLKLDVAARYIDGTERQKYHEPVALITPAGSAVPTGVVREYRDQVRRSRIFSTAGNLVWSADLGPVANRVLAGADYSWSRLVFDSRVVRGRTVAAAGLPCPLSLANPVYRACDPATYTLPRYTRTITTSERGGVYLLDEATIGPVVLTGGIRRDSFTDVTSPTVRFTGRDTSYRAGAVLRVRPDLSLFAQYATSFEPQAAAAQDPRAGGPFAPTTGDIVEVGIKTALMNGRVQSSLSAYRISRKNILQSDPRGDPERDGVNNSIAFGEIRSKGIDLDLAADLTPDWVLTLAYAYNDTRVTRDNGRTAVTNAVGRRFANAPKHQLGFWTRYQFRGPGLALALGSDHVSERLSLAGQRVRPYMVFDTSLIWTRGPWNVLLRVDNLFDKTYAASGFTAANGHFPGEPRSAFVELSYRFR